MKTVRCSLAWGLIKIPRIGRQNSSGAQFSHWSDMQNNHAPFVGPADDHGYNILINNDVPAQYLDVERHTTPAV